MDDRDIPLPQPPAWPHGEPVPEWSDPREDGWLAARRRHRLARINGACPKCCEAIWDPSYTQFLRKLARPRPADPLSSAGPRLMTPEGELASFVQGSFEVEDRPAFTSWAETALAPTGGAFAHRIEVDGEPWVRALLWFDDEDRLQMEAASLDRWLHLEVTLESLWPPVWRGFRILAHLDDRLDAPFRPLYPAPPTRESAFARLVTARSSAGPPGRAEV